MTNVWVPDGYKDTPVGRTNHRELLKESLDRVFAEKISHPDFNKDAVEAKLFWIGSESYVVGSHEFYMVMPFRTRPCSAWMLGIFTPRKSSRTRFHQRGSISLKCYCTSAMACAGTAIMSSR